MNIETDFYLGISEPRHLVAPVPVCIAHHRLQRTTRWSRRDRGRPPYMVDSGAYMALAKIPANTPRSELEEHGYWRTDPRDYALAIAEYHRWIGRPAMVGIQDWMCEAHIRARTGMTVAEHQALTVESYLELTARWNQHYRSELGDDAFLPTLQGDETWQYVACIELYRKAGVDLLAGPVGLGSVCRRQSTLEIVDIVTAVTAAVPGIRLHGFGVKTLGLSRIGHLLASSDSEAWSKAARHGQPLAACVGTHRKCTACLDYALEWRTCLIESQAA